MLTFRRARMIHVLTLSLRRSDTTPNLGRPPSETGIPVPLDQRPPIIRYGFHLDRYARAAVVVEPPGEGLRISDPILIAPPFIKVALVPRQCGTLLVPCKAQLIVHPMQVDQVKAGIFSDPSVGGRM